MPLLLPFLAATGGLELCFKKIVSVDRCVYLILHLFQMQNLDVEETIQKNGKTRFEIRKELEESITNGKSNKNIEIKEKVNNVVTREDAAKVVQEFEQIIKNKKPTLYG